MFNNIYSKNIKDHLLKTGNIYNNFINLTYK